MTLGTVKLTKASVACSSISHVGGQSCLYEIVPTFYSRKKPERDYSYFGFITIDNFPGVLSQSSFLLSYVGQFNESYGKSVQVKSIGSCNFVLSQSLKSNI